MASKEKLQIGLEDTIIENPELEKLLEERQEAKEGATAYRQTDKKVKEAISKIEAPTPYRVGRFIISRSTVPGKTVSFDTVDTIRYSIKTADEE